MSHNKIHGTAVEHRSAIDCNGARNSSPPPLTALQPTPWGVAGAPRSYRRNRRLSSLSESLTQQPGPRVVWRYQRYGSSSRWAALTRRVPGLRPREFWCYTGAVRRQNTLRTRLTAYIEGTQGDSEAPSEPSWVPSIHAVSRVLSAFCLRT